MTRIVAGVARGRKLAVPGSGTRPTSDRVREALFSALDSERAAAGLGWSGARVLDLFAGTGAFGLEALSRGASVAFLVENSRPALRALAANVATVGAPGARVVVRDVRRLAADVPPAGGADLCFADPPYDWPATDVRDVLAGLAAAGWLAEGARVIVERPSRDPVSPLPDGWTDTRARHYGDTLLWYGRLAAAQASPGSTPDSTDPAMEN